MEEKIYFKCVKVAGKLRIRITSPGYNHDANCQFPRSIRKEGAVYSAPKNVIKFSQGANRKFFYRVAAKYVKQETDEHVADSLILQIKVFGDDDTSECSVCLENEKDIVFVPCGHYCCCNECYESLPKKSCIMCRANINQVAKRDQIQT